MIEMDDFIEEMEPWNDVLLGTRVADEEAAAIAADDPFALSFPPGNSSVRIQLYCQY